MNEFPYYDKIVKKKTIKKYFQELKKSKYNFVSIEKAKEIINYKFEMCEGKYVIMLNNYNKSVNMNSVSNYFNERCRMKCKKHNKPKSPIDYFEEIKEKYQSQSKNIKEFREKITYHLWENKYMCQLFKITVIKHLYHYFKAKNILDFSAGWGDRLVAAGSLDVKYTGVDPSECMKPIYNNIIKTLFKDPKKYKMVNKPFEKVNLKKEAYDLVFSSPPFFKLEIYEKDNIRQSVKQYDDVSQWLNKFLFVVIDKCYTYLKKNGYFCIHISDYSKFKYVKDMLDYIKNKTKFKYVGKFYYIYQYDDANHPYSYPIFIRIYKK